MNGVLLLQLPLHPATAWEPTGNIPLAPGEIAAAAGLPPECVLPDCIVDSSGDQALLEELAVRNPGIIGVTLYLWNRERTVSLLREYKKLAPGVLVVAGGPEVTADNLKLIEDKTIDLLVSGEGESRAGEVLNIDTLRKLLDSGQRFLHPVPDTSPPDRWPDPYETGHLQVPAGGSVHLETQRGCGCLCSYCAYRRTSPVPRTTPAEKALVKLRKLVDMGAGEFVFLDPTFNARDDLHPLLEGMASLKTPGFAEARGDLLNPKDAAALGKAGFTNLEVGLQTMNSKVLRDIRRGGNPHRILAGARLLADHGVTPLVDLILGLPGDSPSNIESAAEKLVSMGISDQVQTFCLSVLPGTELRAEASSLGISYMNSPPYCVTSSGNYTLEKLLYSRNRVSDILGYDADPPPRPVLCDDFPGTEIFRPGITPDGRAASVRHGVIRIVSDDPWAQRDAVMRRILHRRKTDPFCPLDVVLETRREFPLNLLEDIASIPEPDCYDREKGRIYGISSLLRTAVISERTVDPGWLDECSRLAVTVVKAKGMPALPGGRTGLLLKGEYDLSAVSALYSPARELVFFSNYSLERLWNLDVLGLG